MNDRGPRKPPPGDPGRPEAGGSVVRPAGDRGSPVPGAGLMGMIVLLGSLGMLFVASLIGYFVVRLRADEWGPAGGGGRAPGLWLSTALILGCSVAIHVALSGIRKGNQRQLTQGLLATFVLASSFTICQVWNWYTFYSAEVLYGSNLYGFTFYMLTGLHGAHVVAGLVGLGWVSYRAWSGAYSWAYYPGVLYNAVYWHFLDVVWLVVFVVFLVT